MKKKSTVTVLFFFKMAVFVEKCATLCYNKRKKERRIVH